MFRFLIICLTYVLTAVAAVAATFDFTTGLYRNAGVHSVTSDGVTLEVAGGSATDAALIFDVTTGGGRGLGVAGSGDNDALASQIESWGEVGEVLRLSFDSNVRIDAISFAWVDGQDRATLGSAFETQVFKVEDGNGSFTESRILFDGLTGTEFTLAPQTWELCLWLSEGERCGEQYSGFRVTSIEASEITAVVPLPMTPVLLITGLIGLWIAKGRRKS